MIKIFKRLKKVENELEEQDKWYYTLQTRLSRLTKETQTFKSTLEEITKELEKVKKVIEDGRSKS